MKYLYLYLIIINALAFLFMLSDKTKAKKNLWRIPERILLGLCAVGGSLGGMLGMRLVRHKTKHPRFSIGIPVMVAIHIMLLVILHIVL